MQSVKPHFTTAENPLKTCNNNEKTLFHFSRNRDRKPDNTPKSCSTPKSYLHYIRKGKKKDHFFSKGGTVNRKLSTGEVVEVFCEGCWRKGTILEVLIEGLNYIVQVDDGEARVPVEVCLPNLRLVQESKDGSLINPLVQKEYRQTDMNNDQAQLHIKQGICVDASSELETLPEGKPADNGKKRNITNKYARRLLDAKFSPGTTVKVRSNEDGHAGSWYAAVIVHSAGVGKFLVEYKTLKTIVGYLKEIADEKDIRPYPPYISQSRTYKVLEEVDVWYNNGWREGVISEVLDQWKYTVFLTSSNDKLVFQHYNLRKHQNWVDGKWVLALQASKVMPSDEEAPEEDFRAGMLVEVRSYEEAFRGSWYTATIIGFPAKDKLLVEFQSLKTKDDKQSLIEEVPAYDVRPSPPDLHVGHFKCFEEVDAFCDGGWWAGVISEVLSRKYMVYFASTGMTEEFDHVCLRPHQDWINGKWIVCKKRSTDDLKLSTSSSEREHDQSNYVETFSKGTAVEVRSDDRGFEGSWYSAVIVRTKAKNKFLVEYMTLKTEDQKNYLREVTEAYNLRPFPPTKDVDGPYRLLETVDAWYNDGWWQGVISKVLDNETYMVYFKITRDELEFDHRNLRIHQEWIQGKWISANEVSDFCEPKN